MRRHYSATQDASIYEDYDWKNAGLDEILEVGKDEDGVNARRSLIKFDIAAISASIAAAEIPYSASFDLTLRVARADDLKIDQQIHLGIVSQSWVEGSGYFYQNINVPFTSSRDVSAGYVENDGTTWEMRQSGSVWATPGAQFANASIISASATNPITDFIIDVTSLVRTLVTGSVNNNGFLIKFPDASESDTSNVGNIQFFSRNTHTIYEPLLVAKWSTQAYTASLTATDVASAVIIPKNLKQSYKKNETVVVNLSVRNEYPQRTFDTEFSAYAGTERLPITSYFSIIDMQSNTVIIPFDEYSAISCDATKTYIDFKTDAMHIGRYYKLIFKVEDTDGDRIFDNGYVFSIQR